MKRPRRSASRLAYPATCSGLVNICRDDNRGETNQNSFFLQPLSPAFRADEAAKGMRVERATRAIEKRIVGVLGIEVKSDRSRSPTRS